MKSHFLSQLSGICSGIALMSSLIESDSRSLTVFIGAVILSFVFIFWSQSEQENEN